MTRVRVAVHVTPRLLRDALLRVLEDEELVLVVDEDIPDDDVDVVVTTEHTPPDSGALVAAVEPGPQRRTAGLRRLSPAPEHVRDLDQLVSVIRRLAGTAATL